MNIIEALKQNKEPFGLMSEEMQAKAEEIGKTEFDVYHYSAGGFKEIGKRNTSAFIGDDTYHLCEDYQEGKRVSTVKIEEEDIKIILEILQASLDKPE